MSKSKHNKKRNTAFLYEILLRELTKAIMKKKPRRQEKILKILKERFNKKTNLYKDLEVYKTLTSNEKFDKAIAEKILNETRRLISIFDNKTIYDEQTEVIKQINKTLSKTVFMNFVPNYKSLATIKQMFDPRTPPATKVLLEEKVINSLSTPLNVIKELKPLNSLAFKTFIRKFNSEYLKGDLLEEQKKLLSRYVSSFNGNGDLELKIFMNEEIGRLKKTITGSLLLTEVKNDSKMLEKTKEVLEILENFKNQIINKESLEQVLKIQQLAEEIKNDN